MFLFSFLLLNCFSGNNSSESNQIEAQLAHSGKQFLLLVNDAKKANRIPRTITEEGTIHWTNLSFDWTEGFFPGTCWYLFEYSKDQDFKEAAEKFQAQFEDHKFRTNNHDLGFVFNCSFGNGYRITGNEAYKEVLITAANSLITRFNPTVGCIQSWDVDTGWQAKRGWKFPVIIDNMMNLELLFKASELTGDEKYRKVAIAHANTTLKNHYREDNSSCHVVDYDPETGEVRSKQTAQGYSDSSSWARGQAWGLYGYTVCYRYTKDKRYLDQAEKIAKFITANTAEPNNGIPFWDYDAPQSPDTLLDVSAAAITASGLYELIQYSGTDYKPFADNIIRTLGTEKYSARIGENQNFILKHSVGSIPHNAEIDVPLNYADYYYVEALMRKYEALEQQ